MQIAVELASDWADVLKGHDFSRAANGARNEGTEEAGAGIAEPDPAVWV
jgi:hypothetical protein